MAGPGFHAGTFLERTLHSLSKALENSFASERTAQRDNFLQGLDPRTKVVSALALIIGAAFSPDLSALAALFVGLAVLAFVSGLSLRSRMARVWAGVLIFAGVIGGPAIFLTPGQVIARLPILGWPLVSQGIHSAVLLVLRMESTVTVSILLISTTPWTHVLKSLRVLRVPVVFIVILAMTCRFIFLLLQTAVDMFQARRSRVVGRLSGTDNRRLTAAAAAVLLGKTQYLSEEVYAAMVSRGYRGEVYLLHEFGMTFRDWIALAAAVVLAVAVAGGGRWTL